MSDQKGIVYHLCMCIEFLYIYALVPNQNSKFYNDSSMCIFLLLPYKYGYRVLQCVNEMPLLIDLSVRLNKLSAAKHNNRKTYTVNDAVKLASRLFLWFVVE